MLTTVTGSDWPFGPYLERWIRDNGLTNRAAADLADVSETTIRILIRGYTEPRPGTRVPAGTTVPTITKLSNALGFPLEEGLHLVGLQSPRRLIARHAPVEELTVDDLLAALRGRFSELSKAAEEAEAESAPLSIDAMRARGLAIVRLDELVAEVREAGDPVGADQIAALSAKMLREVEAAAARQVNGTEPSNGHAE